MEKPDKDPVLRLRDGLVKRGVEPKRAMELAKREIAAALKKKRHSNGHGGPTVGS